MPRHSARSGAWVRAAVRRPRLWSRHSSDPFTNSWTSFTTAWTSFSASSSLFSDLWGLCEWMTVQLKGRRVHVK